MHTPINQIQPPDDQDEDHTNVVQESSSFLSYYNHNFACFNGVSTAPSDPFQFQSAPPPKKRKSEAADGGGRVVRAAGRKDRHSKVRTARGPRDRRVRLSPTTAIQFYDVQDRLGYDRPSKAIDWLIKEAKAAIDALGCELPRASNAAEDHGGGFSLIMRNKHEHLNDNDILASSSFGCFSGDAAATEVAAPPPAAGCLDRDYELGFFPALNPNWEMARLQKMFTWNSVNESLGNARGDGGGGAEYSSCNSIAAAQPNSGHANLFREPLQSSYASINNDFGGFNFSSELSKIAASATPKQDENLKKLIFSNYHQE